MFGGAGNDTVFGGQCSDTLDGGEGNDWLSGELGNDSLIGGPSADRVRLAAGTAYTLSLSVANAVISLGVDQIVLVGTGAATADWVVFA